MAGTAGRPGLLMRPDREKVQSLDRRSLAFWSPGCCIGAQTTSRLVKNGADNSQTGHHEHRCSHSSRLTLKVTPGTRRDCDLGPAIRLGPGQSAVLAKRRPRSRRLGLIPQPRGCPTVGHSTSGADSPREDGGAAAPVNSEPGSAEDRSRALTAATGPGGLAAACQRPPLPACAAWREASPCCGVQRSGRPPCAGTGRRL